MNHIDRRTEISRRAVLGGLPVGLLALAGCATSPTTTESSGEASGSVTLRFQSLAFQESTIAATQKMVDAWNQKNPDVQVKYVQGSWDSVQDQLVTQFAGGTAPDIIQYESAAIGAFAQQGYLADLTDLISDDVRSSVPQGVMESVTFDGKVAAVPTLMQSYLVFANTDLLEAAGVTVPSGETWSWDDFQAAAKATTQGEVSGVGWGLAKPTATVMSMGMNFGATYFSGTGEDAKISIGSEELELPRRIYDMTYVDRSIAPVSVTQNGGDVLPAFLAGQYAMTVQGSYVAQTISESASEGFNWAVLPPLSGSSADQSANPQTLSISARSKNVDAAAKFLNFYMGAENLASVAEGDWLIPTSKAASAVVAENTGGKNGWPQILASGDVLTQAPYQSVDAYPQWKDQIATPALQEYLGDKISIEQLQERLQDGYAQVAG